jgi:hypothetical protein
MASAQFVAQKSRLNRKEHLMDDDPKLTPLEPPELELKPTPAPPELELTPVEPPELELAPRKEPTESQ